MKVDGTLVLVTGAGSGMGRELALELVRRGARVAAVDMRTDTLQETKDIAGAGVEIFPLDVTNRVEVAELPEKIRVAMGAVDILINNAGIIQPFIPIQELAIEDAERVMNVNFYGPLTMIQAFLPTLRSRPKAHILNVSSMGAYAPVPGQSVYGASKAALKLLTEGLRSELLNTNIGTTIAFPGAVATNITSNSGIAIPNIDAEAPQFKSLDAPRAARIMIDAIEKDKARVTVGKDARTMDLLSRINPIFAANLIYKQMKSLLRISPLNN
jgi:NADP-dependent 3-hydroxy acid dehydrogenase YdfG